MNNKYMKWAIGVVLTPFILIVLLAVALYLPPIQNRAVKTVAAYASEEMGMEVSVERVLFSRMTRYLNARILSPT